MLEAMNEWGDCLDRQQSKTFERSQVLAQYEWFYVKWIAAQQRVEGY
jgi:hypothetical protein